VTAYVEVPVGDGTVLVEVREQDGIRPAARPGEVVAAAGETLERSLRRIREVAAAFAEGLSDLPRRPEEIEVEFGLSLTAEAKLFVAATKGEASFAVRVTWFRGS
jgi:hypothetical protein